MHHVYLKKRIKVLKDFCLLFQFSVKCFPGIFIICEGIEKNLSQPEETISTEISWVASKSDIIIGIIVRTLYSYIGQFIMLNYV